MSGNEGLGFLRMVNDGLDTGVYPAQVRAAVYQALSHLPNLEVVEKATVIGSTSVTTKVVSGLGLAA